MLKLLRSVPTEWQRRDVLAGDGGPGQPDLHVAADSFGHEESQDGRDARQGRQDVALHHPLCQRPGMLHLRSTALILIPNVFTGSEFGSAIFLTLRTFSD